MKLEMSNTVSRFCDKHGNLKKEQIGFRRFEKKEFTFCKPCKNERITEKRRQDPEKYRKKDLEQKYLYRDPRTPSLTCRTCKIDKDISEFSKIMINIRYPYCKKCKNAQAKSYRDKNVNRTRSSMRHNSYKKYYKIGLEQYEKMQEKQKNLCAICSKPQPYMKTKPNCLLGVDHCHETGKVRGLLCNKCNLGLGYFLESQDILESALAYLNKHSS
jgi:hypothetical protein